MSKVEWFEYPAFERNGFKEGDMVVCYRGEGTISGKVVEVKGNFVDIYPPGKRSPRITHIIAHFKQCRLLGKKRLR